MPGFQPSSTCKSGYSFVRRSILGSYITILGGGWDYYNAHAINPDRCVSLLYYLAKTSYSSHSSLWQSIVDRVRGYTGLGGVGLHQARSWHNRIYSGLVSRWYRFSKGDVTNFPSRLISVKCFPQISVPRLLMRHTACGDTTTVYYYLLLVAEWRKKERH